MNSGVIKLAAGIGSAIGVIFTGYFTYKATIKYLDEKDEIDELDKKEKIIKTAKIFGVPITIGAVTIALIAAISVDAYTQTNNVEKLTTLAAGATGALYKYRGVVEKRYGKDVEEDIYNESIDEERVNDGKAVFEGFFIDPGTPLDELCYVHDQEVDDYIFTTLGHVILTMMIINREFALGEIITYNTIRNYMNVKGSPKMNDMGYIMSSQLFIDFDITYCGKTKDGYKVFSWELPPPDDLRLYEPYRSCPPGTIDL